MINVIKNKKIDIKNKVKELKKSNIIYKQIFNLIS